MRKYFSIVFVLATLLGVLHHHSDLKQHSDCKVCQVKSSLSHADTPVDTHYLTTLELFHEAIVSDFTNLHIKDEPSSLFARAPPTLQS